MPNVALAPPRSSTQAQSANWSMASLSLSIPKTSRKSVRSRFQSPQTTFHILRGSSASIWPDNRGCESRCGSRRLDPAYLRGWTTHILLAVLSSSQLLDIGHLQRIVQAVTHSFVTMCYQLPVIFIDRCRSICFTMMAHLHQSGSARIIATFSCSSSLVCTRFEHSTLDYVRSHSFRY